MCGFYYAAFIEYTLAGKTLLDYTDLFSPNDYKKRMTKYYRSILRTNMSSIEFILTKIDEKR